MKKLFSLALALALTLSLAACDKSTTPAASSSTPTVSSTTPAASEPASTPPAASTPAAPDPAPSGEDSPDSSSTAAATPTATNAGLPDGYKLEVEQTGEKSGIVRLTDPNLQESYPASDASFQDMYMLYSWMVAFSDIYSLGINHYNDIQTGDSSVPVDQMESLVFRREGTFDEAVAFPLTQLDGNTIIWQFEIPDEYDFSWNDVIVYTVTIINEPLKSSISADVPNEDRQSNLPSTTDDSSSSQADASQTAPVVDDSFYPGIPDDVVPDVLKYYVGTLGEVKYTGLTNEYGGRTLTINMAGVSEDVYQSLRQYYYNNGGQTSGYILNTLVETPSTTEGAIFFEWGFVQFTRPAGTDDLRVDAILTNK